jgi:hypothetical protein
LVGASDGDSDGRFESVGAFEGWLLGLEEGEKVGKLVEGASVGRDDGAVDGRPVGSTEGVDEGPVDGYGEGNCDGNSDGTSIGTSEGWLLGLEEAEKVRKLVSFASFVVGGMYSSSSSIFSTVSIPSNSSFLFSISSIKFSKNSSLVTPRISALSLQ